MSAQVFFEYRLPEVGIPGSGSPASIAAGSDGNLWFTEQRSWIGRITTSGVVTEFPVNYDGLFGITPGPDGNIWFTFAAGGESKICRMTPDGVNTQFGSYGQLDGPAGIVSGPDGNLWFTETSGNRIDRITTAGVITPFGRSSNLSGPVGITAGPDGNLWFTENTGNRIGRITPQGEISQFPVPTAGSKPWGIAGGPDGNVWFTEATGNRIGRIRPDGQISEFLLPARGNPVGIVSGPGGALWFTEQSGNRIGRISTSGEITEFMIPTPNSGPDGIAVGPDGKLWFAETLGKRIGQLDTGETSPCSPDATTLCLNGGRFQLRTQFETPDGSGGDGRAVGLAGDSGYFTFFDPGNVEVVAKVLNGCAVNERYWVFAGGLTNVHVVLTVVDMRTGASKSYENPLGIPFAPIQDTNAFPACPE